MEKIFASRFSGYNPDSQELSRKSGDTMEHDDKEKKYEAAKKAIAASFHIRLDNLITARSKDEDLQEQATSDRDARKRAIEELQKVTGADLKTVKNWLTKGNPSIPYPFMLKLIADRFSTTIGWLLGETEDGNAPISPISSYNISPDEAIANHARHNYDAERQAIFKSAAHSLWIRLRSGKTLNNADPFFGDLQETVYKLKPAIRLLICDPQSDAIKQMLAYRLGYSDLNQVVADITDTVRSMSDMARKAESSLEIGYCPYFYSTLCYILNPPAHEGDTAEGGRAVTLISGFNKDNLRDTLMIRANSSQNPIIFNHFVREYERLWRFTIKKGRMEKI